MMEKWKSSTKLRDILHSRPVLIQNPQASNCIHPSAFLVITNNGIFIWGNTISKTPRELELYDLLKNPRQAQILDIAFSRNVFGLLLGDGKPYFCALASHYRQLTSSPFFKKYPLKIVAICCGDSHFVALSGLLHYVLLISIEDGNLLVWKELVDTPAEMEFSSPVKRVLCGSFHTFALTESNEWFAWGSNVNLQISSKLARENIEVPTIHEFLTSLQLKGQLVELVCGQMQSYAITKDYIYGWGMNAEGSLGLGHCQEVGVPELLQISPKIVARIAVGYSVSAILKRNGSIMIAGDFSHVHGNPLQFKFSNLRAPRDRFKSVAIVDSSVILLTENGQVRVYSSAGESSVNFSFIDPRVFEVSYLFGLRNCHLGISWRIQRILWIAWLKNLPQECHLASLPKPLIHFIIENAT